MVAAGLIGGPLSVGLMSFGLNTLPSLAPALLSTFSPLIRVLVADLGNQNFPVILERGIQWVQPNKGDQKGEQRNVNDKSCLSYQQTKPVGPSSHQPLLTLISALRRNLSVVGVGNGKP